ncbi:ATP-grasp fold amidoligase family protein [Acidisoma sp. 7E03]
MQWRKVFDQNPAFAILCDKLAVREFIKSRIGDELLTPLLWAGAPEDIPFDRIVPPFALKSTHASGQVIMVGRDDPVDQADLRARAGAWLTLCHGTTYDEPGYTTVPRRLMIERTVTTAAGTEPEEVRLFVFDGKVAVINTVFVEDGRIRNGAFHTPDWTRLNWHFTRELQREFPKPERLSEMIEIAEQLGEGFDHVRVDIYDAGEKIWIGEITVYSWSGHARFSPDEADKQLGDHWRLRAPLRRGLQTMLFSNFRL